MAMNPEIKQRWVAALRSGEYKQAHHKLADAHGGYCCLGVLCDLYAKENGMHNLYELESDEQDELPGVLVTAWAALSKDMRVEIDGVVGALFSHNDGFNGHDPRTFSEIAAAIEEQL